MMNRSSLLTSRRRHVWTAVQAAVWTLALAILLALIFRPQVGIHAFWNVLIPVAPALLVFAPGLWRNICPLGSTAALACSLAKSGLPWSRRRLSLDWQGRLNLLGVLMLLSIVPLRHVVLDTSGPATALTIVLLAGLAVTMALLFEAKSGWCSGICPVHGVEKLYGQQPVLGSRNMHCETCRRCVGLCPDATPNLHPLMAPTRWHGMAGLLLVGGFPGFVWGFFQVPDFADGAGWAHLPQAYGLPLGGLVLTLGLFLALRLMLGPRRHDILIRAFAAGAVGCYYWYRLPALFGFGPFPGDGMLVDLRGLLPAALVVASRILTSALFLAWLVPRSKQRRGWATRPPFAQTT